MRHYGSFTERFGRRVHPSAIGLNILLLWDLPETASVSCACRSQLPDRILPARECQTVKLPIKVQLHATLMLVSARSPGRIGWSRFRVVDRILKLQKEPQDQCRKLCGPDYRSDLDLIFADPVDNYLQSSSVTRGRAPREKRPESPEQVFTRCARCRREGRKPREPGAMSW